MTEEATKDKPKFLHTDCPSCRFIGTHCNMDVYKCGNEMGYVVRWGSESAEYTELFSDDLNFCPQQNTPSFALYTALQLLMSES